MKKKLTKSTLFLSAFIILLFCFLPGWGQESGLDIPTGKETAMEGLKDTEKEYFCVMLLTAYELYEKECYNDSTTVYVHKDMIEGFSGNGCTLGTKGGNIVCINLDHYEMKYNHKEPTFQGFIEFMRKYGESKKSK